MVLLCVVFPKRKLAKEGGIICAFPYSELLAKIDCFFCSSIYRPSSLQEKDQLSHTLNLVVLVRTNASRSRSGVIISSLHVHILSRSHLAVVLDIEKVKVGDSNLWEN